MRNYGILGDASLGPRAINMSCTQESADLDASTYAQCVLPRLHRLCASFRFCL